MNLFQLASRGIDLDALPDESAPEREPLAFEPSPAGSRFAVPQEFDAAFQAAGDEYGVDPDVLRAMAFAESRFRPDVISGQVKSRTGAAGLMQFMPGTAERFGINPLDPVESIFGAAAYMRANLEKFDGDYGKAVAAYNWGENRKAYGAEDWQALAPKETQGYLKTVFGAADELKLRAPKPMPPVVPPPKEPEAAKADAAIPERSWGEAAGDTTKSLAQGLLDVASLPGVAYSAVTGDYDTGYLNAIKGTQDVLQDQKSPELQARNKALQDKLSTAEGWREKLAVGGIETLKDPTLLADTLLRSAPGMAAGGLAGRAAGALAGQAGNAAMSQGLTRGAEILLKAGVAAKNAAPVVASATAVGTSAATQGASVAKETFDELMKLPAQAFSAEEGFAQLVKEHGEEGAKSIVASAAANRALAVATATSVASMKLVPGGDAIEKMFLPAALKGSAREAAKVASANVLSKPLTQGMQGGLVSKAAELLVQGGKTGALESLSEGIEESTGAMAKGLELSRAGQRVNLSEMMGEAGGQGVAAGLAMGKVAGMQGAYENRVPTVESQPTTPTAPVVPQAPPNSTPPTNRTAAEAADVASQILQAEQAAAPSGLAAELEALRARSAPAPDFTQQSATPQAQPGSVPVTGGLAAELQALRARSSPQEGANAPQRTPQTTQPAPETPSAQAPVVERTDAPVPASAVPAAGGAATTEAAGVGAAPVIDPATRQPATSWVLRDKSTGAVVMETSQKSVADKINTAKYEAVPIGQHLASLSSPPTTQGVPANVPQPAQPGTQASQTPSTQGAAQGARVVLQNRDRSTPSSIAQMRSIAARPDYGRLGFSRDFANGAPVVAGGTIQPAQLGRQDVATASDGRRIPVQYAVVDAGSVLTSNTVDGTSNPSYGDSNIPAVRAIAGNGRIAGLQSAYQSGNANAYRQELVQDAALHGIAPEVIAPMAQPVLVRVMPAEAVTADIGDISNTVGNLDLSAVEQASNDANRVTLDALQFAEDGSITPEVVRQFVRAMPQAEQGQLLDTNGQPTRQAVDRLSAAVFAKAYGNEALTRLYSQAQDPEARLVMSALAQVAPKMARLEGAGALDIRDVVAQAAEIAVNARRQGVPLARAAQQLDIAADPAVSVVLDLFAANSRSVRPVVEALARAADAAYTEATKPAEDMFGTVPRAGRADIINQLRPENERRSQEALEDAAGRESAAVDAIRQANDPAGSAAPATTEAGRPSEDAAEQGLNQPVALDQQAQAATDLRAKSGAQAQSSSALPPTNIRTGDKVVVDGETYTVTGPLKDGRKSVGVVASREDDANPYRARQVFLRGDDAIRARIAAQDEAPEQQLAAQQAPAATEIAAPAVSATVDMPPTRQQEASRFADFATGRYRIGIRDDGNGPYAEVVALRRGNGVEIELRMPSEALEHPAFAKLNARAQALFETPTANMFDADPATLDLAAQTPAEAAARQDAQEQEYKAEAAAKRAEDAAAKADEDRKRIAQASVRASDEFELGLDPLDSLTGQGGLRFSRGTTAGMPENKAPGPQGDAQQGAINRSFAGAKATTPIAAIRQAITSAYGNLLQRLESKGLVTLTQTQGEAIEAAARARADKTGQPLEEVRASLMASVSNSVAVDTPAFQRWFGDSKVVDADGKPLMMYHGTVADFDAFDNLKTGANDMGLWGRGHYFASSPTSANSYALRQGDGARVIPAHVSIQNPLVLRTGRDLVTRLPDGTDTRELIGENLDGAKIKAIAMDGGHDGVIQIKPDGSIGDVVAFRPEQIKSASGNNGDFDPNNPDIRFSRSPSDQSQAMTEEHARQNGFTLKAYRGISKANPFNDSGTTWLTTSREVAEAYAEEVMGYDDPGVLEVMVKPDGLPRHDASRLTDEQREAFGADEFGNPQSMGIYDRSDDHPLGGSRGNVTVIHAPREAVVVLGGNATAASSDLANPDIRRSADGAIEGFFDPQTGQSFLIADNLTAQSAPGTLMHEVGIHMAADGKLQPLFERAAQLLSADRGNAFIQRVQARMDRSGETSGEEAAAYIVTEYENDRANSPPSVANWVQDFTAAVRAWLFGKGVLLKADQLTVADIAAVARANARSMARGDGRVGDGGRMFSKAPSTAKVAGGDTAPVGDLNGALQGRGLDQFKALDDIFALPKSTATDLQQIARENGEEVRVRTTDLIGEKLHTLTFGNGTEIRITERKANPYGQDQQVYAFDLVDGSAVPSQIGRPGENPEDVPPTGDVWLDVSQNTPAKYGAVAYNIAATFAHNTGQIFVGDPAGLSDNALRRRTEQMLSSALKFGTTEHLAPHPRQVAGDASLGVPPLKWVYGDHVGNTERMIDVSLDALDNALPNERNTLSYDRATGQFRSNDGNVVQPRASAMGRPLDDYRAGVGKAQAGWRTLARAAYLRSFRGADGRAEGSGILDQSSDDVSRFRGGTVGSAFADPKSRIFYSRTGSGVANNPPPIPTNAQAGLFAPSSPWELPQATRTDRLIYELQDGRIDLKRVQEAIAATGKQITEGFDARLAETLMPGRIARRTESFLSAEVKPLLESMAKNNVSQDELSDYLLARHAPERNAQIAKVNDEMPDGGAGTNSQGVLMTTQAARDHIAALTQGKRLVLDLLAKRVDDLTIGTREVLVREGLEKQETVDAWTGAYKHYVPLFKDEAMETPGHPIGAGVSVTGTASKRATGSTGEVTNMLAHILMQREAAITRAEKNRVAMSLYGLALTNPNAEMWTTIRPSMPSDQIANELVRMGVDPMEAEVGMQGVPTIRGVDPVSGKVVDRPNPMYKRLDNSLVVKVNGEDRVILFNASNERAVRLVRNLKNQDGVLGQLDLAGSIVGKATRYFASINTQYNPAFGMVNIVRDVGGAMVNLTDTALAGKQARVLSDSIPAMIGIARDLRGDAQRTPWSDLWQQFQDDGGRTGYRDLFIDPYKRADAVQSELERMAQQGKLTPGAAAHAVLDLLDGFNTTLENGVRLSAYKAALDKGMSRAESARLARELTLDFNRKGRAGREMGPLFAFFNASVQGTARTLKALQGPAGKRILIGGLSLGVIQALLLSMAGFDDDEIPEFVKARAFIIPLAGKQYITIPLQFGLNALPNTGRVVTELLMSGGKDWGEKSFNALGELAGSFNPLGGGNIFTGAGALKTISPTVIDPIVDMATNTDFTGKPIGKERMPWDTRPGFTMGREGTQRSFTGQAYIGISKAINSLTGGNDFAQGLSSPSPEEVRYVFTTVGGGVFRELEKILNASVLTAQGEDLKAREVPLGSRFAGEVEDQDLQRSRFFKNSSKIEKLEAQLKGLSKEGRGDEVRKLIDDNPLVKLYEMNDEVRSNVTKLNKLASESINDKEALKRIDAARTTYMRALNDKVLEMENAGR